MADAAERAALLTLDDDGSGGAEDDPSEQKGRDQSIQVYARIRPPRKRRAVGPYTLTGGTKVRFTVPRHASQGYVNNMREEHDFRFNGIFDMDTSQLDVFQRVGVPVATSVLDGYNATVFAYGQTGSGKTYTITGGPENYDDRGLIPRTISWVFQEIEKRTGVEFSLRVSYLEIYNNAGYDLLDPDHESKRLEDLRKVSMMEDEEGNMLMKNLGMLPVQSEEDALNLLFVGDTNRVICETPSNDASSRSHCIFTINVEARDVGSSVVRRSKLHLVDLAGSERVKKTDVGGKILEEAKGINLSLHFLQQVIVALHERAQGRRAHIPYRNSMMTSVLRDSLGGNCMTVMVATMSVEEDNIEESVATSGFAARVAQIRNQAKVNTETDPWMVIQKLKLQVRDLREQLNVLQGGEVSALSDDDRDRCRQLVREFLQLDADASGAGDADAEAERGDVEVLPLANPAKVVECFHIMKEMIRTGKGAGGAPSPSHRLSAMSKAEHTAFEDEIRKLRLLVHSRDNEIAILLSMLKKKKKDDGGADIPQLREQVQKQAQERQHQHEQAPSSLSSSAAAAVAAAAPVVKSSRPTRPEAFTFDAAAAGAKDRNAAFEMFRKSYRKNEVIEERKAQLREKYAQAKQLGEGVNRCRQAINHTKALVERRRVEVGMQRLASGEDEDDGRQDPEEARLMGDMEAAKQQYKEKFSALKQLKAEIEHLQHVLEKSRRTLQRDFEAWWRETTAAKSSMSSSSSASSSSHQAAPPPNRSPAPTTTKVVSTGNKKADDDIAAFYRLRDEMLRERQQQQKQ